MVSTLIQHLHVANVSFEEELEGNNFSDLLDATYSHPLYLQLQFLPLLYADENDLVFVTDLPDDIFRQNLFAQGFKLPELVLSPPAQRSVESWGMTPLIKAWAEKNHLRIDAPDCKIIREVNSKEFSFLHSPLLPGAALLRNWQELSHWVSHIKGPKVLKSCFGVSGRGHLHFKSLENPALIAFSQRQWALGLPLIGEPWVERTLDFSTQWIITKEKIIHYLGPTICLNDLRGRYQATIVGEEEKLFSKHLPFLEMHKEEARKILETMKCLGYFGHVGFDAMIYGASQLHPIVEINARKTMGWVALAIQKRCVPKKHLKLFLSDRKVAKYPLLPSKLSTKTKREITFQKQLCIEFPKFEKNQLTVL